MSEQRVTDTVALKKLMIDHNLEKIGDLAAISGANRVTLGNILRGKTQPSAEVMVKLVNALQIPWTDAEEIFFSSVLHNE